MTKVLLSTSMVSSECPVPSDVLPGLPYEKPYDHRNQHQPLLQEIQSLMEALTMTGVRTRQAKQLEARLTRAMSLYFRRLAKKFPYSSLTSYVNQYRSKEAEASRLVEAKKDDAKKILGKAVETGSDDLIIVIENGATKAYELGSSQAAAAIKIKPTFALVDEGAKKWIRKRAAGQVTNINEVTRDRLARVLIEGVDRGQPVPKISRSIRSEILEMTRYRANMIAQNELNESMSEASMQTYKRLDITYKSWSSALEPCEICEANEAEGVVPIDHIFSSGHRRPPAHPHCLCTITPEKVPS